MEVFGQTGNDRRSPALGNLTHVEHSSHIPVKEDQFPVRAERGAELGTANPGLDVLQEVLVVVVHAAFLSAAISALRNRDLGRGQKRIR